MNNNMSRNMNNNFNNNPETKNESIVGYLILILIIVGLVGYIVYDKDLLHIKKEVENSEATKKRDIKLNYNILYQIGNTLDSLDSAFNEINTNFTGYIYTDKKLLTSKFNKEAALYSAVRKDLIASSIRQTIANGTVKSNFEKMYGTYLTYEAESIEAGNNYNIYFDQNANDYYYTISTNTNIYLPKYYTSTTKTEVDDEDIVVTRKLFYVEYTNEQATIYKDETKKETIGQLDLRDGNLNEKEVIDKFSSKLKTFAYRFKRRKDDDYSFYSIERIK